MMADGLSPQVQGGQNFTRVLASIGANAKSAQAVRVGFLANATYPGGTKVATVAFWNEFGTVNQVPRPFFRRMIAKCSPQWGAQLSRAMVSYGYDAQRALAAMGLVIKDELVSSIVEFLDPPLRPSTVRKKGFDKPLIDTGVMQRAPDFEVVK